MVVTHTHAKGRSVQKLELKRTDGRTDGGDCIASRVANAIGRPKENTPRTFGMTVFSGKSRRETVGGLSVWG